MEETTQRETNQHDVEIAKVKAEVESLQLTMGSELIKLRDQAQEKTERLRIIVGSTERVLLVSMLFVSVNSLTANMRDIAVNLDGVE